MALYVGRLFLVRSFSILFALVLILQTLDLLGESGQILAVAGNSDSDVWRYVGMRLPQIIETFLPFSVLLGTILTMVDRKGVVSGQGGSVRVDPGGRRIIKNKKQVY